MNYSDKPFSPRNFLLTVPTQPGVYCMRDDQGTCIYVGKAKNLHSRLASYFHRTNNHPKTVSLVAAIHSIEFTITHTETEALLLENNYIKQYKPRYNVLLRDNSSYPYILLTAEKHPRLLYHRGPQRILGEYFGPFPSAHAVHETITLLQKLFPLRLCENNSYRHRTRPCLQYQIGRCSGICVPGLINEEDYQQQVKYIRLFLQGKDQQVIASLVKEMEEASRSLHFEQATALRDKIQSVRQIIEKQSVIADAQIQTDVITIAYQSGVACVQILFIRHGKLLGSKNYFPAIPQNTHLDEVGQTFIGQFYLHTKQPYELPNEILLDFQLAEDQFLSQSLSQLLDHKIKIFIQPKGKRANYLKLARTNAQVALKNRLAQKNTLAQRFQTLAQTVSLQEINRLECFDISHTMGEKTVASCVVFNRDGPLKSEYRRYYLKDITTGDDYAAMAQVLQRRYSKPIPSDKVPDIIFIDGGKGQLGIAIQFFSKLDGSWGKTAPQIIAIAKGKERKPGLEKLFYAPKGKIAQLVAQGSALHLIQHIRDEAHRHAITGHRKLRGKALITSWLECIPGIGSKRRHFLLTHMGGFKPLLNASVEDLATVPTISKQLAERIYQALKHKR